MDRQPDGYIYLVQTPQYFHTDIYKIGSTKYEDKKRFNGYPKGTRGMIMLSFHDHKIHEKKLIALFREKFDQHYEGREYFDASGSEQVDVIIKYYLKYRLLMDTGDDGNFCWRCFKGLSI